MTNEECLGRLVVSATHDLRNALAVIRECTGLVDDMLRLQHKTGPERGDNAPRMLEALAQVQAQVRRGAALAEGMGHMASSAGGGEGEASVSRCDLNRVVVDFCTMIARRGKACLLELAACPAPEPVTASASTMEVFRDLLDVFDACAAVGGGGTLRLAPVTVQGRAAVACQVVSDGSNTDMVLSALTSCPLLRPARSGRDAWPEWLQRLVPGGEAQGRRFLLHIAS